MVLLAASAGASHVFAATRGGVGLSRDSFVYLSAARHIAAGQGVSVSPWVSYELPQTASRGNQPVRLTHFPPLYPAVLSAIHHAGMELRDAARWLNIGLFGVTVAIVGRALARRGRSAVVPVMASAWLALSVDLIHVHAMAWSEPLSLTLGFGGLAILARSFAAGGLGIPFLVLAAALTGLASITRYAGLVYVGAGAIGLATNRLEGPRGRLSRVILFLALALLPTLLLAGSNLTTTGRAANREIAFHAPSADRLVAFRNTAISWLIPESLPRRVHGLPGTGVVAAGLIAAHRLLVPRKRKVARDQRSESDGSRHQLRLLAWFISGYLAFLLVSLCFLDRGIPMDFRILAPVHVALIWLAAIVAGRLEPGRFARATTGVMVLALLASKAVSAVSLIRLAERQGLELSAVERRSPLLALVRALPDETVVGSNAPELLALLADRPIARVDQAETANHAFIACFRGGSLPHGPEGPGELRSRVTGFQDARDGTLYTIGPLSKPRHEPKTR